MHQLPGVPPDTALLVVTDDDVALYLRNDADFDHLPAALDQLFHAPTCHPTDQPIQLTARWNGITGIEDETAPIPEPPYTLLVHVTNSTPTRYERADLELTVPRSAGHPISRDDIFDHLYTGDTLTTTVTCASDGGFLVKQLSFRPAETETATP